MFKARTISVPAIHLMSFSQSHSCTCAYVQELEQGWLSWKSAALPLYAPLLKLHLVLFHGVSLSRILGQLCSHPAVGIWGIHISPLSSGILHHPMAQTSTMDLVKHSLKREKMRKLTECICPFLPLSQLFGDNLSIILHNLMYNAIIKMKGRKVNIKRTITGCNTLLKTPVAIGNHPNNVSQQCCSPSFFTHSITWISSTSWGAVISLLSTFLCLLQ